jgi:hypothetical protein
MSKKKPDKVVELIPGRREALQDGLDGDIFDVKDFLIRLCDAHELVAVFVYLDKFGEPQYDATAGVYDDPITNAAMRTALQDVALDIAGKASIEFLESDEGEDAS